MQSIGAAALFPAITICLFNWIDVAVAARTEQAKVNAPSFDWYGIEPSSDLKWHECYSAPPTEDLTQHFLSPPSISKSRTFKCALLSLPLDYHNTTNHHNVSVPILKISSPPSSSHRGTIITALGGAGNSRIRDLITISSDGYLLDFLDAIDSHIEYDFLTFDNRGFGYSSPSAKCFDSVLDGALWEERMTDLGGVMSTREGEKGLWIRLEAARAKGELCAKQSDEDADIRRHMTTAYAARDMLEILKRLPEPSVRSSDESSNEDKRLKLKFLGLSYGTMVGQTFASLYPEHVDRMVLDGACDANDWVAKWQMGHLIDTDAVWASFYEDCFHAKEACPLWRAPDTSPVDIEIRFAEFMSNLRQRPAYTVSDGNARLITYRDVKLAMYWTTMALSLAAPIMATTLDGLMKGHTNVTIDFPFGSIPSASNFLHKETEDIRADSNADAGTAVNCGDAEDITNSSSHFIEYLSILENQSAVAAFFQGERKIRCLGWPIRPAWRFTGPFTSKTENGSSELLTPILFIGNKLDPMASLTNSRKVLKDYPRSVILEQDARGHCALGSVPSPCILKYVRDYLRDGNLPEQGTVCGKDCNIFDGSCFKETNGLAAGLFVR